MRVACAPAMDLRITSETRDAREPAVGPPFQFPRQAVSSDGSGTARPGEIDSQLTLSSLLRPAPREVS